MQEVTEPTNILHSRHLGLGTQMIVSVSGEGECAPELLVDVTNCDVRQQNGEVALNIQEGRVLLQEGEDDRQHRSVVPATIPYIVRQYKTTKCMKMYRMTPSLQTMWVSQ